MINCGRREAVSTRCFKGSRLYNCNVLGPQVMKATFPITRCLVGGSHGDLDADEATALALNQLLELVQVRLLQYFGQCSCKM